MLLIFKCVTALVVTDSSLSNLEKWCMESPLSIFVRTLGKSGTDFVRQLPFLAVNQKCQSSALKETQSANQNLLHLFFIHLWTTEGRVGSFTPVHQVNRC